MGKRTLFHVLALLTASLALGAVSAVPPDSPLESEPPAPSTEPAHGGHLRLAGALWLELVVEKSSLTVYVTDRVGAPADTSGAKGSAIVHTDGKATHIKLNPAGGNRLTGMGRLKLKRSSVVFVTADLRGKRPYRAAFRPLEGVAPHMPR